MKRSWLLIIALLIGVGSIANDNRANALLVYLSKPCSKTDYLVGKWFGIFVPMAAIVAVPTLFFYGYCAMSYRDYGFIHQDPWLIVKLIGMIPIAAGFHASVALGISSMFNQGRLAGAVYAGIYFMTGFVTFALSIARSVTLQQGGSVPHVLDTLFYFSVDGVQIAIAKIVLGTSGHVFLLNTRNFRRPPPQPPDAPNALLFFGIYIGICVVSMLIARSRIRAVEVIGS